jgi:hypothetical protein
MSFHYKEYYFLENVLIVLDRKFFINKYYNVGTS